MEQLSESVKIFSIVMFAYAGIMILYLLMKETGIWNYIAFLCKPHARTGKETPEENSQIHKFELPGNIRLLLIIILLVLSTRFFMHIIGWLGYMLIKNESIGLFNSFQLLWSKWDAEHYIGIARDWYATTGDERFHIVFFPFYPVLVRIIYPLIGNWFWSGILVSNLSLVASCFFLYKLVEMDYSKSQATNSVKYLLFFPVSFFLAATFSESLFIALSLMCMYYLRRKKWIIAGLSGLLAAFTRSPGVLLVFPFFVEILLSHRKPETTENATPDRALKNWLKQGAALLMVPCGTFLYLAVNKKVTGDWFKFLEYQSEHWHQRFGFFADNLKSYVVNAFNWKAADKASLWIPQLVLILGGILLLVYGLRRIRLSYSVYMFVYLLVCISPTWLLSGPRYLMGAFPIYLLLALLAERKTWDIVLTFVTVTSLSFCILAYVTGHLIM